MIVRVLATAAVLALLAVPALADEYDDLVAKFDVAFTLNTEGHEQGTLKRATDLREEAQVMHEAGNNEEALKLLKRAMNVLTECRC